MAAKSTAWRGRFRFGSEAPPQPVVPYAVGDTQRDTIETGPCAEAGCEQMTYGHRLCPLHLGRKKNARR